MNSLAPAFRELARGIRRQVHRLCLHFERRRLRRLETALGLLGWQQADYDSHTLEHVRRLTDFERAQGRLANESAALALEIQHLEAQRVVARQEFAEVQAAAIAQEHPGVTEAAGLEALLAAQRQERREIETRLGELDQDLEAAEAKYRSLVAPESPIPQAQAQLLYWRKVILAIPQEKAGWTGKLALIEEQRTAVEKLLAALRESAKRQEQRDQAMVEEIAQRQRAKRKIEKQSDDLEKAKTAPYREIGRALADYDIAPLNQPEALDAVQAQRQKIAAREAAIATLLPRSGPR